MIFFSRFYINKTASFSLKFEFLRFLSGDYEIEWRELEAMFG